MNCECGKQTEVIDSRLSLANTIRRRRKCPICGRRFSTIEIAAEPLDDLLTLAELLQSDELLQLTVLLNRFAQDPLFKSGTVRKILNRLHGK
jgi:hypothetical protein